MVQWIEAGDRPRRIAVGLLALLFGALLIYGRQTHWLPWSTECDDNASCHLLIGEALAAIQQAWGNLNDGLGQSWLLLRNGPDLYIHNQNFGAYLVVFTALLGADGIGPAGAITAAGFVIGLAYAYLLVERTSRSPLLALVFLGFFVSHLYLNTLLGLNLLRAWHWLPLFGVAYHTLDLFSAPRVGVRQILPLVLLATIGFAVGYEFYAFVVATAVMAPVVTGKVRPWRRWPLLGVLTVVPFVIRQFQVMGGVGVNVWAKDLFYTAALKSPLLRTLSEVPLLRRLGLQVPPVEVIVAWYKDHSLFHGAPNNLPISAAYYQFIQSLHYTLWHQDLGDLTIATMVVGFLVAPLVLLARRPRDVARYAAPVVLVAVGQVIGFLVFGYHALLYFIVGFEMPLVVSAICLSVAFVVTTLIARERPLVVRVLGLVLLAALVVERVSIEWWHLSTMGLRAHPPDARWSRYDFIAYGGMWGNVGGWVILILAGCVGFWLLCHLALAFLRCGATWRPEPAVPEPVPVRSQPVLAAVRPAGEPRSAPEPVTSSAALGSERS